MTTRKPFYKTNNLYCILALDMKEQLHYQIFEFQNTSKPVAIYSAQFNKLHLADEFPLNVKEYKYFNEMCEIIQYLYSFRPDSNPTPEQ